MKKTIFILSALVFIGCSDNKNNESEKESLQTTKQTSANETKNVQIIKSLEAPVEDKSVKKSEDNINTNKIEAVVEKVIKSDTAATRSGKDIYHSCAACHGQNAEKMALNKSKIIRGWEASKTVTALNGYKNGSYGGTLKNLMKAQTEALSDDEIEAVSKYISKL